VLKEIAYKTLQIVQFLQFFRHAIFEKKLAKISLREVFRVPRDEKFENVICVVLSCFEKFCSLKNYDY